VSDTGDAHPNEAVHASSVCRICREMREAMTPTTKPAPPLEGGSMTDHRWSGWPGAVCLNCGVDDQREECIGTDCPYSLRCAKCGAARPNRVCDSEQDPHGPLAPCPIHVNGECSR
jgi:hypothetical protein